ncbi:MAG: hypothetical protein GFH27_549289n57 [Chloroflexi bacterium AL-W]|nr:hypothetical protein [Chloroflexi bacterium AL-N1]NOK66789.1 hypothetical protein [Chloroflexi bacterium AL-N10]NOK74919.1 hypothetical protein [Chloroflexi bacterium AL-N5]NOK81392.1 hypothetical protein [Chloroflexi bacterium AL-W]NOK88861.1 hypothetical protein [Chloroflexi bacterium AL-N15]
MFRVHHRHRSFPIVVGFVLLSLLFTMLPGAEHSLTSVAYAQSCNAGLSGFLEQDTNLSNDVYITGNVTVRGNATLTIEPGTRVIMCGAYTLAIGALFNPGRLVAIGTPDQPIRIEATNPNTKWNSLFFAWGETEASILRHVILTDGGGNDPNDANAAAISISNVRAIDGPIFEHVTVEDRGGITFDPFSVVDSVLRHVKLQNGGGNVDDRSAVIAKSGSGQLTLDHVKISGSANGGSTAETGVYVSATVLFRITILVLNYALRKALLIIAVSRIMRKAG